MFVSLLIHKNRYNIFFTSCHANIIFFKDLHGNICVWPTLACIPHCNDKTFIILASNYPHTPPFPMSYGGVLCVFVSYQQSLNGIWPCKSDTLILQIHPTSHEWAMGLSTGKICEKIYLVIMESAWHWIWKILCTLPVLYTWKQTTEVMILPFSDKYI